MEQTGRRLNLTAAALIFAVATGYFFLLIHTLYPYLRNSWAANAAAYWFLTGYFLFVPLFVAAVLGAAAEGNRTAGSIAAALALRKLSRSDWLWAFGGLVAVLALTGAVFGLARLSHQLLGTGRLNPTPWFMHMEPFEGAERWLLLLWLPMFFFNIVGEEILWRGYIQSRLTIPGAWIACSALWLVFHLPFGLGMLVILLPALIIVPFVFHKTGNTLATIFIHGMFNGPMFVAVALGLVR